MTTLKAVPVLAFMTCAATLTLTTAADAQELQVPPPATSQPVGSQAQAPPPDDKKDSGLGLEWVWLNAEAGFSYIDLKSAKLAINPAGGSPISVVDSATSGSLLGFGAGVRFLFLTVGLRARNHTAMNLWQIDGEVAFHGRIGRIDPYLAARFGYDTVGTLSQSAQVAGSSTVPADVSVHGWNGGLAFGMDYYFSHLFSLGAEVSGDVIFLKRPPASAPPLTADQQNAIKMDPSGQAQANYTKLQDAYSQSGSSVGFGGGLTAHVGLHF